MTHKPEVRTCMECQKADTAIDNLIPYAYKHGGRDTVGWIHPGCIVPGGKWDRRVVRKGEPCHPT